MSKMTKQQEQILHDTYLKNIGSASAKNDIMDHLRKMLKDAQDECHAYALRFLKTTEPEHRSRALALDMKVITIKRILEFVAKGK
jgi:hypothetical protein